jgi:hypothetical protein
MKLNDIRSADLPEIDDSIKECVNLGQWLLFRCEGKAHARAAFYLKTGSRVFELNDRGKVLQQVNQSNEELEIDEVYYFSDLPRPRSLSNSNFTMLHA